MGEFIIVWAQRGICVFLLIGLFLFLLGRSTRSPILQAICFCWSDCLSIGNLCYKNVSLVVMKRLLIEANVIIIVLLGLYNLAIEIVRPDDFLSPFNAFGYSNIYSYVFRCVDIQKSISSSWLWHFVYRIKPVSPVWNCVRRSFTGTVLFEVI